MFPPASLPPAEALAEDRRARESEHAWLLGRLVWPAAQLSELPQDEGRALAVVEAGTERQDEAVYLEGVPLDEVAARGLRAKIRCGGERIPTVEEMAEFVRGCRARGLVFKATAGLHHAYPTEAGEHGFLNLLAAVVFGNEEEALRERSPAFALDAAGFRWRDQEAAPARLADVRASLFHSIGTCSFFEPAEELERLGVLA
ncbi:MAG TPA: hypothetical protein VFU64_00885 [Gaiellaceae bacterium]|nr:hypothetical protein [Gaiellaceae bacterium]